MAVSLQYQDAGSIPGPEPWVKEPAFVQLWPGSKLWLSSDPWPAKSICLRVAKKVKKKKKKKKKKRIRHGDLDCDMKRI